MQVLKEIPVLKPSRPATSIRTYHQKENSELGLILLASSWNIFCESDALVSAQLTFLHHWRPINIVDTSHSDNQPTALHSHIDTQSIAFGGTFLIDVRQPSVDPPSGQEEHAHRNWDLDEKLVDELKDSFKIAIRRYALQDRICVVTSERTFGLVLQELADENPLDSRMPDRDEYETEADYRDAFAAPIEDHVHNKNGIKHRIAWTLSTFLAMTLRMSNGKKESPYRIEELVQWLRGRCNGGMKYDPQQLLGSFIFIRFTPVTTKWQTRSILPHRTSEN